VHEGLTRAGISLDNVQGQTNHPELPSILLYHILSNLYILLDPRILSLIRSYPLSENQYGWDPSIPPPGIFLLMVHECPPVREWARGQVSKFTLVPIPNDRFITPFSVILEPLVTALTGGRAVSLSPNTLSLPDSPIAAFSLTSDLTQLWTGFGALMRLVPPEYLASNQAIKVDLRRFVIGHLHDTGPRQFSAFIFQTSQLISC
jgi:senataxin